MDTVVYVALEPGKELVVRVNGGNYRARVVAVGRSGRTVVIQQYSDRHARWCSPRTIQISDVFRDTNGDFVFFERRFTATISEEESKARFHDLHTDSLSGVCEEVEPQANYQRLKSA